MQHLVTFSRDVRAKFGIPNSPQFRDIRQNPDGGISDFRISGQSLIKQEKQSNVKKFDEDVMLTNFDVIAIF